MADLLNINAVERSEYELCRAVISRLSIRQWIIDWKNRLYASQDFPNAHECTTKAAYKSPALILSIPDFIDSRLICAPNIGKIIFCTLIFFSFAFLLVSGWEEPDDDDQRVGQAGMETEPEIQRGSPGWVYFGRSFLWVSPPGVEWLQAPVETAGLRERHVHPHPVWDHLEAGHRALQQVRTLTPWGRNTQNRFIGSLFHQVFSHSSKIDPSHFH